MKCVSFYHKETGLFNGTKLTVSDDSMIGINTPADHIAIEDFYDHLSQRVDIASGQVIDYQPPAPSADHEWNVTTKRWQLKPEIVAKQAARAQALRSIASLEASQARTLREFALGVDGAKDRLHAIDQQIAGLR